MLQKLNTMNVDEHAQLSLGIIQHVMQLDVYKNAKTIGVTISRYPEVDTRPFIEAAWEAGKNVAVPKCIRKTRAMDFRLITSFKQLETVYIDLLEPIVNETNSVRKEEIDLQIVPGVVFSNEGFRIGFGGGYYDRYLADYKGDTISLAFNCQTNQVVPTENHDIPVNTIITERNMIDCQRNRKLP
ncbi:5-formyltetrahydrofolate cyclo-ligase family protein [Sporosarcina pasteurii]|uniref:5-formyltetrahydrofolate cyclo-ligase n=2 Tax=Sporosarcina pasteurii TaxID=1474 RepID=A0A380BNB5_SPOPA|nr:5-formyltetrahydrofolate cyclo-ligase family protein [Sporosarcina pasteurii]